VTPEVDALLDGHVQSGLFPDVAAEKLIGIYCAGQFLTVSRELTKKKPDVEQLVGFDEVWALCPRKPPPGWRLLGRWYEKGVFVALRAWDKNRLAANYPAAAQEVIEDWRQLFGTRAAHSATSIEDYLDGVFRDVDQQEE